ncbi:hypothetical protein [Ramlibacter sp. AN1133]|uniref:hypothetical protein n=1 Tax=Ramlibacter sp. AN1133 TaxID=3133429 RepID=UPI0030C5AB60
MTELTTFSPYADTRAEAAAAAAAAQPSCEECMGTGGWYRYEPALDPGPGLLYLSCLQCCGSGRLALPRD